MNTNSNTYTVVYATVLVVVVAAVLAFAAMSLKPAQEANVKKDTISQILTAASVEGSDDILGTYRNEIAEAILVNEAGEKIGELSTADCQVYGLSDLKKQIKAEEKALPVYIFKNGVTVVPCYGAGLWGPIWGYVGFEQDLRTIKSVCFGHKSESFIMNPEDLQTTLDECGIQPASVIAGTRTKPTNPVHTEVVTGGIPSVLGNGLGEISKVADLHPNMPATKLEPKFPEQKPLPKHEKQRKNSAERVIINQPR